MKLLKAEIYNFASYDHLEFNFDDLGLSLISGSTGSGKSTLFDIATWVLFGQTAKDGSVDDVRSWNNKEDSTTGTLQIKVHNDTIVISRIRGKPGQNDLFWTESNGNIKRGKDISDTQKLLSERMGIDSDTYFTSAYYCEFSPTASFFVSKIKDQREVFEKVANLELPIKLLESVVKEKKEAKSILEQDKNDLNSAVSKLEITRDLLKRTSIDFTQWQVNQDLQVSLLQFKKQNFDQDKIRDIEQARLKLNNWEETKDFQLNSLLEKKEKLLESVKPREFFDNASTCPTCGNISFDLVQQQRDNDRLIQAIKNTENDINRVQSQENPNEDLVIRTESQTNQFDSIISIERNKTNPFKKPLSSIVDSIEDLENQESTLGSKVSKSSQKVIALEQLYDISFELRAELLKRVVREIEKQTNIYLDKHFDSELKVQFIIENSDKLEIKIEKNGHDCVFKQLSKGQRQLLKLCFGVSVMKASANRSGIHVDTLMFDEALDGLDSELKVKAFDLFSELEKDHGSVVVIDHSSELKELFVRRFNVVITGDVSSISEN